MTTVRVARRRVLIIRLFWLAGLIALVSLLSFLSGPRVGSVLEGLTPPDLPRLPAFAETVYIEQNWDMAMSEKFHHISQGTNTLPIPASWFMALEQPSGSLLTLPFGNRGKFIDSNYLLRFGFIESVVSEQNPNGLPIGFAITPNQNLAGIETQVDAIGFNCAACHTAHLVHGDTEYVIEGGPASSDLGLLTKALGAALGQTLISSKVPLMKGRFNRFARNVLNDDAFTDANIQRLGEDLQALVTHIASQPSKVEVVEGFTRLDALNRIGNQVFALDPGRFENYEPINAPVNYPHIWTASWFNWVQYNGSIMSPLVRNTGEAMGVAAHLNLIAPVAEQRFSSSIDVNDLWWIENSLSGDAPYPNRRFAGLLAPQWPTSFPEIDRTRAARGAEIYQNICINCHLPPLDSDEIWNDNHFSPVSYFVDNVEHETPDSLLQLDLISLEQVGTDPAQANVLQHRTVNTAAGVEGNAMGINTEVCAPAPALPPSPYNEPNYSKVLPAPLVNIPVSDGPMISFGLALGALVQQVNNAWFEQNYIAETDRAYYEEYRPNCLRVSEGYKARPLNGIWATAPFLHNGSVPTLMDMVTPPDERPKLVILGNIEFDAEKVGIKQDSNLRVRPGQKYDRNGHFILDTSIPGNSNQGHEFSHRWDDSKDWWEQEKGVIGPEFTQEDRASIVEYLKTL